MPAGVLRSSTRRTDRSSAIRPRRASEAQDGAGGHSPYTQAFLRVAREPNLPIEQLFKRVRLEVNNVDGRHSRFPWESSSLTSDFYFFGDTAVAATRAPDRSPVVADGVEPALAGRYVRPMTTCCRRVRRSTIRSSSSCSRMTRCATASAAARKPGAGAGLAQDRARELAGRLQDLLRQLRQQPLCASRAETAVAAEECAADAVDPSHEAAAGSARCSSRPMSAVEGQFRHQAG